MENITLEKYRDLTRHLVCALRNYEMSSSLDDRSYAVSILSNVTLSARVINCKQANIFDIVAMNYALKKAQEILHDSPAPSLITDNPKFALH